MEEEYWIMTEELDVTTEEQGIEGLMRAFAPLVRATARRYVGRGAEEEDLEQEGWLALVKLYRASRSAKAAQVATARNLRGMVRDAAARMRRGSTAGEASSLDAPVDDDGATIGELMEDCDDAMRRDALDAIISIEMRMPEADARLMLAAAGGATTRELASDLGVSQQAVCKRMARIRQKLTAA